MTAPARTSTRDIARAAIRTELAQVASLRRGEVRRLKKLLDLPQQYHDELLEELEKPRADQKLSVDQVLEATRGAESLRKRGVINAADEERLRRAMVDKFRTGVIVNTVAPRQLARISRAVERGDVEPKVARESVMKIASEPTFTIDDAFKGTVRRADVEHSLEQLSGRLAANLELYLRDRHRPSEALATELRRVRVLIDKLLRS